MNYLVVAVPNDPELAAWIGKKGSVNGITFYNRRLENTVLTVLTPSNLEEKFYGLAEVISLAGVVVISTREVNAAFGEAVIAAALIKKHVLLTNENDVGAIIGKLGLSYEIVDRSTLLESFEKSAAAGHGSNELRIAIDKAFPVKGVGTVLLGVVQSGTVNAHDKLLLGNGKELQVRSIQVQDEDNSSAAVGARVGLAVKGVEYTDLDKGEILAKQQIKPRNELKAAITLSPMQKEISAETQYTLVSGFADAPCKIAKEGDNYSVKLGTQMQLEKGQKFIILREKSPRVLCGGEVL